MEILRLEYILAFLMISIFFLLSTTWFIYFFHVYETSILPLITVDKTNKNKNINKKQDEEHNILLRELYTNAC